MRLLILIAMMQVFAPAAGKKKAGILSRPVNLSKTQKRYDAFTKNRLPRRS